MSCHILRESTAALASGGDVEYVCDKFETVMNRVKPARPVPQTRPLSRLFAPFYAPLRVSPRPSVAIMVRAGLRCYWLRGCEPENHATLSSALTRPPPQPAAELGREEDDPYPVPHRVQEGVQSPLGWPNRRSGRPKAPDGPRELEDRPRSAHDCRRKATRLPNMAPTGPPERA